MCPFCVLWAWAARGLVCPVPHGGAGLCSGWLCAFLPAVTLGLGQPSSAALKSWHFPSELGLWALEFVATCSERSKLLVYAHWTPTPPSPIAPVAFFCKVYDALRLTLLSILLLLSPLLRLWYLYNTHWVCCCMSFSLICIGYIPNFSEWI